MPDQSNDSDVITMTHAQLETMKAAIRTEAALSAINDELVQTRSELVGHKKDDKQAFDALFNEIRKVDEDVNKFPQRMQECQQSLRQEVREQYVSKAELAAGFKGVKAVQIYVGLIIAFLVLVQKWTGI